LLEAFLGFFLSVMETRAEIVPVALVVVVVVIGRRALEIVAVCDVLGS
jgi:hypothetical protein